MKKIYFSVISFLFVCLAFQINAQTMRVVKIDGYSGTGDIETFNNKLYDAIDADSTARKTNPNVVYELTRGHSYPMGKTIKNYNYTLHIRAAAGPGLKPIITPGKQAAGTYGAKYIQAYNHVTLENIELNGFTPTGSVLNRMFETYGKKSRCIVRGCDFDGDRGGMIAVNGDSMKIYAYDCKFGNTGHRKTSGGNGRSVDFRPTALFCDTLVMVNCSHYNQSDRLIRNMNTVINYVKWDHNTAINNVGFHGSLQLGETRTAIVTNNIFGNAISLGHYASRTQEQTQPEKYFSVISLDTVFTGQNIVVRNNNIYTDQVLKTVWAKYDSVKPPYEITKTIEQAIGAANVSKAWFAEPLAYKKHCGPINLYVDGYFTNPKAAAFPENWCVGGEGGFYADEVDLSYGTTATSYTKADGGFPVGDLNFYPDKKTAWQNWIATGNITIGKAGEMQVKTYPNPFTDQTIIEVNLGQTSNLSLSVYDLSGRMVRELTGRQTIAGRHQFTWNGDGLNGSEIPDGIYIFQAVTPGKTLSGRLVKLR